MYLNLSSVDLVTKRDILFFLMMRAPQLKHTLQTPRNLRVFEWPHWKDPGNNSSAMELKGQAVLPSGFQKRAHAWRYSSNSYTMPRWPPLTTLAHSALAPLKIMPPAAPRGVAEAGARSDALGSAPRELQPDDKSHPCLSGVRETRSGVRENLDFRNRVIQRGRSVFYQMYQTKHRQWNTKRPHKCSRRLPSLGTARDAGQQLESGNLSDRAMVGLGFGEILTFRIVRFTVELGIFSKGPK